MKRVEVQVYVNGIIKKKKKAKTVFHVTCFVVMKFLRETFTNFWLELPYCTNVKLIFNNHGSATTVNIYFEIKDS